MATQYHTVARMLDGGPSAVAGASTENTTQAGPPGALYDHAHEPRAGPFARRWISRRDRVRRGVTRTGPALAVDQQGGAG